MNTTLKDKMAGLSAIFEDVVMRDNPNWYMVGFNVTAFMISTFFIGIIVSYLNAKPLGQQTLMDSFHRILMYTEWFYMLNYTITRSTIWIFSDAGKDVSWVLMWPMYTSLNMFMGCFLMNGIVQYVLVVRPSLIPDSWNDKFVAWGGMSFVWMCFILASGIMHCNGILPPSYFSLRGIDHDLSEQAAIVLRRYVLFVCLAIICPLRIIISINPQRSFYSTIVQKLTCFRILNCSKKAERDAGNDDNDNHSIYSKPEIDKKESEPSNQVISNGTLFFWSICWFLGMSLRWIYGDKDLFIADFCSILIFYVYPLLIISTNSNIQQFLKRRMVFLYHRCLQDIFWCMLVVKYFSALGCCRQIKDEDDKESIITVTNGVSGQWAMKIPQDNIESEETHAEFHIENESTNSKACIEFENCVLESVE